MTGWPKHGSRLDRLLTHLRVLALAGQPLPTTQELAQQLGLTGNSEVGTLLRDAEARGFILVRFGRGGRSIHEITTPDLAWRLLPPAAAETPRRACLRCRKPFQPQHRHNFMCSGCGAAT